MIEHFKDVKVPFLTALFIFILFALFIKFFGPIPFFVNSIQTTKTDLFQVVGEGKETAVPDTGFVSFGITKTAATVASAQNETNTGIDKIVSALKNLGIDSKDIKTTTYSVDPNYDDNNNDLIKSYSVTQNIDLHIKPLEKVNKAIDIITANGANMVGSISFGFDDQTQKDLMNKARADAITNAKAKAESLARLSGIHLGRIVNVQEGSNYQPYAVSVQDTLAAPRAPQQKETSITPGQNSLSIQVTLSYETY